MLERAALVEAREQQQVVDEHAHAVRVLLDAAHRLGEVFGTVGRAAAEQLGVAADRRERRAQLVRRVGDEPPQARFGRGALRERASRSAASISFSASPSRPTSVCSSARLDALREVAGGDRARGLAPSARAAAARGCTTHHASSASASEHADGDEELDEQQVVQRLVDVGERDRDDERAWTLRTDRRRGVSYDAR